MILAWDDEKCIACKLALEERILRCRETAILTEEHLIPESIGGKLVCKFLCKHCNDHLGVVEANLKTDARIRCAIEHLRGDLPGLWATMSEGQAYVVQDPAGSARAKLKNGEIRADSWKGEDGSVFRPLDEAWSAIHKMLLRRPSSEDEIAAAKKRFEAIPDGERAEVATGVEVLKRTAGEVYPSLKLAQIDTALLKIAYEFLALHLGRGIFNEYFDPIRSALALGTAPPTGVRVEPYRLKDSGYKPFHGLVATNVDTGLLVKVLLFGYLSYRVEFIRVQMPTDAMWRYTVALITNHEQWD